MAGLNEREAFELAIFRPPHLARMLERAGEFTGRLDSQDREFYLSKAFDLMFDRRHQIQTSGDVECLWVVVLGDIAFSRPRWQVSIAHWGVAVGKEWVKPAQLRRRP